MIRLLYWKNPNGKANFGDDLNPWLWRRILGVNCSEMADNYSAVLFSIGTLLVDGMGRHKNFGVSTLDDGLPDTKHVIVFGTGSGGGPPPSVDSRWQIYCVRGPLTAKVLDLPSGMGITDPAILVRRYVKPRRKIYRYAFMPHISTPMSMLRDICTDSGIHFIDPAGKVDDILNDIAASEMLMAEAMHGAIVADALRVPWIHVRTSEMISSFKWQDWCHSMNIQYTAHDLINRKVPGFELFDYPVCFELSRASRMKMQTKMWIMKKSLLAVAKRGKTCISSDECTRTRECRLMELVEVFMEDVELGRYK